MANKNDIETPSESRHGRENKPHIGIFGRCNSGKSSLLNFITGAEISIVSPESGTTTDVVRKSYEILGCAPVIFLDTAGIDDTSGLGKKRITRTLESINLIDLALLVFREWGEPEQKLANTFRQQAIPFIPIRNITHAASENTAEVRDLSIPDALQINILSAGPQHRERLLCEIKRLLPETSYTPISMFANKVHQGEFVILVCPIDGEAPAGRMILPQVQAIRQLLDRHAIPVTVQPGQLPQTLKQLPDAKLIVTDSQVYAEVRSMAPAHIEVTTFSILLAAAKGDIALYNAGLEKADFLKDGDRILIAESCTHQVNCEDIGRVKIPRWLESYTGKKLSFSFISGLEPLPEEISDYALMVQCGGCMATRSQVRNRIRSAATAGVAVTNYGMLIRKIRK